MKLKQYTYTGNDEWFWVIIGTADKIKETYEVLCEDCEKNEVYPLYMDMPRFNKDRSYGLMIDLYEGQFHVMSYDVAKSIIDGYHMEEEVI